MCLFGVYGKRPEIAGANTSFNREAEQRSVGLIENNPL
ncbi:MAG: hypothetical protein ACI9ND_003374 [Yoonia sp.]|jgi:hypothetical protein